MTRMESRIAEDRTELKCSDPISSCLSSASSACHRFLSFRPRSECMPSVSVIVPVRNESRSIEHTLRLLLTQDFPPDRFEVIVADGASTDDTVPIVRRLQAEFANLKLVFNPGRFSSAGRNTALRHAAKDVAGVVDGHCHVPDRNYLQNVAEAFAAS